MGFAAAGAGTGKSPKKMADIADMMLKVFLGRFSPLVEGHCARRLA
jgi:hypothetical protein